MISLQGVVYERLLLNEYKQCFFFQILHDYPLFLYVSTPIFNLNDLKLIVEYYCKYQLGKTTVYCVKRAP